MQNQQSSHIVEEPNGRQWLISQELPPVRRPYKVRTASGELLDLTNIKTECNLHGEWAFFTGVLEFKNQALYGSYACPDCRESFLSWIPAFDGDLREWLKADWFSLASHPDLKISYRAGLRHSPTHSDGETLVTIASDGSVLIETWRENNQNQWTTAISSKNFLAILTLIRQTSFPQLPMPQTLPPDASVIELSLNSGEHRLAAQILESEAKQLPKIKEVYSKFQELICEIK